MNSMKRLTLSIRARLDQVLSEVENHEALAQSALKELHESIAGARVGLNRVERDESRLNKQKEESAASALRWRERAKTETDQGRALECLRRARRADELVSSIAQRLLDQRSIRERLTGEVRQLEVRYSELQSRYHLMRTREARARAFETLQNDVAGVGGEVERVFERWEGRVTRSEYEGGVIIDQEEDLEARYLESEERQELMVELQNLRGES
ncbi:MAG TPA: PspA/IM30 family protein [Polyangiaceae bacterium]|nr:PspA/IM30 family protein [Polyangiaceae bacterium]